MSEKYLEYSHNQVSEDTVAKFYHRNNILVEGIDVVDLLKYNGGTSKSNIERIFENYSIFDRATHKDLVNLIISSNKSMVPKDQVYKLPLYKQTTLLIPKDQTKLEFVSLGGKNLFLERSDFTYFWADNLYKLLVDPGYVRSENLAKLEGRGLDIEVIMENVQVWLWSRALNKIIDVSPFITNVSIDKSDIGSFTINLNPIKNLEDLVSINRENVINYFNLNTEREHHRDFFYDNFQYNDIAFIRFEKLELDRSSKSKDYTPTVEKTELPNQIWDMIGLVDTCSMNQSYQNSSHEITISGRDFMKLLIEDGSFFMNLALLQGSDQKDLVVGFNKEDKWFKRNIYNGRFGGKFSPFWFPNSARSIRDTIGFIVNQLSNLGVLGGEDLFSAYQDKRTKKYVVSGISDENLNTLEVDGIWQIIKIMIDSTIDKRRISDDSLSYVDGTILEQINKACQMPFVEFFGDTYGNEFNLVVRQPPFTKDMITSFLSGVSVSERGGESLPKGGYKMIEIEAKDLQGYSGLQYDTTYYSWFQLNPNDSFLGAFNKLAMGSMIPIIYFSKIAECFGNHRLIVSDNYLNANVIEGAESAKDKESYRRALLSDLKYVIDSNIYLPFTRKGTITLTKGDRRIKRGTFIRVLPTREIFYVDSVSNSISFSSDKVDRSTTLRVSRGMIEDYIYGAKGYNENGSIIEEGGRPVKFRYFDIANTRITSESSLIEEDTKEPDSYSSQSGSDFSVTIGAKNSQADKNNNPGNLQFANQFDSIMSGRWAKFSTTESGFKALIRQIQLDQSRGLTVKEFIYKFHPISENGSARTQLYIDRLNMEFKVNGDTKLSTIDATELAKFIAKEESATIVREKNKGEVIEKIDPSEEPVKKTKVVWSDSFDFSTNEKQFEFFLKRKHLNIYKYGRSK